MSAAVVHRPNTILPKFNFLLAGGAVVLSIIAITDNVGSNSATVAKPAAVSTVTHKAGAGTARPQHAAAAPARGLHQGEYSVPARGLHEGEYYVQTPKVQGRLVDESRLVAEVGTKVVAPAQAVGTGRRLMDEIIGFKIVAPAHTPSVGRLLNDIGPVEATPSVGRLLDDVGPVQAFKAGTCGLKVSTTC